MGAQSSAFTYQGRLSAGGAPATGLYDVQFTLFGQAAGGSPAATPQVAYGTGVTNGNFTVLLDFGTAPFSGADRWLELAVRPAGSGSLVPLSPRQLLSATPYALKAREAATVPVGTITGAMLADGAVDAAKLQPGAALQNLLDTGVSPVSVGGVVMSDDPGNAALTNQGYARIPNAEISLVAEEWRKLNPPAPQAEYIPAASYDIPVSAGGELLVFRFYSYDDYGYYYLGDVLRYNLTTKQWSKGSKPPDDVIAPGATAVWTGSQVILWGGSEDYYGLGSHPDILTWQPTAALIYTPATDTWTPRTGTGAVPLGRTQHTAVWTGSRMVIWGGQTLVGSLNSYGSFVTSGVVDLGTGAAFDPATGQWTALSTNAAPSARRGHTAVWTGSRMLVHGGTVNNRDPYYDAWWGTYVETRFSSNVFNTTFSYNPGSDSWTQVRSDSTSPRMALGQAVWTGREMFVYGGQGINLVQAPTGWGDYQWQTMWLPTTAAYSYNPTNDFWTFRGVPDYNTANANGRMNGTLLWTGSEVVTWAGTGLKVDTYEAYPRTDGQAYNMTSGTWRTLPDGPVLGNGPAGWVGNQMVVSGSPRSSWNGAIPTDRAAFNPTNNTWSILPNYFGQEPLKQDAPSVVWTGKELIVWGGPVNGVVSNRGRRYNVATGKWTEMSTTNAPAARMRHSAVWTGSRMVVWGGDAGGDARYPATVFGGGGAYDPATDTWTSLPNAPFDPLYQDVFKRTGHKAVWTAYGMVVVGGSDGYNDQDQTFPRTIARLSSNLSTWTLSSSSGVSYLLGRWGHCLGSDGQRTVFLWGGQWQTDQDPIGYGGMLIDASNLSAQQVDAADEPEPVRDPSMVWSGKEFIVWGGTDSLGNPFGGGGKFNPNPGYWTPPSVDGPVINTPFAGHAAVWSGTEMLLWGGTPNPTGVRYNPRNDGWVNLAAGPTLRSGASAAWTGTNALFYLPALSSSGAIPELWSYRPPAKVYLYLKQ